MDMQMLSKNLISKFPKQGPRNNQLNQKTPSNLGLFFLDLTVFVITHIYKLLLKSDFSPSAINEALFDVVKFSEEVGDSVGNGCVIETALTLFLQAPLACFLVEGLDYCHFFFRNQNHSFGNYLLRRGGFPFLDNFVLVFQIRGIIIKQVLKSRMMT